MANGLSLTAAPGDRPSLTDVQQPPQVGSLGLVAAQLDGAGQLGAALLDPAGPEQQLPPGSGQPVAGQLQALEQREPGLGSVGLRYGDRSVEPDDWRAGEVVELAVARGDPRPVGVGGGPARRRARPRSAPAGGTATRPRVSTA